MHVYRVSDAANHPPRRRTGTVGVFLAGTTKAGILAPMPASRSLRTLLVDGPRSLGEHSRRRRWNVLLERFPNLAEMSVIDLGGTVEYWLRAPVQPRHVHLINLEDAPADAPPAWIRHDIGDATRIPDTMLIGEYDLVYSNSVIEHVGGHERRQAFAGNVLNLAPNHWIQTPYRYFPVEPHWVCPFMQYLPLAARTRLGMHWPLVHTPHANLEVAVAAQLQVELLDITAMRHYFPDSTLVYDRFLGLVKSVVAVRRAASH